MARKKKATEEEEGGDVALEAPEDGGKYVLVEASDAAYEVLAEIRKAFHEETADARISLVWDWEVEPDADGHMRLGQCRKVSKLEQQFHEDDFLIILTATVWRELPAPARRALLDHEMNHVGVKTNDKGEKSFYMRKHDLEEFESVVRRHGLWRTDVEKFVNAALKREQTPLFDQQKTA